MSSFRRRTAATVLALLVPAALATGCSTLHPRAQGLASDVDRVQVVSTQVGDKNVYIPSTLAVSAGTPTVLSVYNTTDVPHGFAIPALGIREILPAQQELEIPLPALEGPRLFAIQCHLHTAHRTATLLVMPGEGGGR